MRAPLLLMLLLSGVNESLWPAVVNVAVILALAAIVGGHPACDRRR
jgi:hypothetical protein